MSVSRHRAGLSALVLLVLAAFVVLGRWYELRRATPALAPAALSFSVASGADRGPGTLRDALFAADTASAAATILIRVSAVILQNALPPIVNPHGIRINAPQGGVMIDARALHTTNPVFDVDADNTSIADLSIQGCQGTAILVRAARFRLSSTTIRACDVGVDVAGNVSQIALERNHFEADRIGVRFSAASADTEVLKNQFDDNVTAGMWLVASQPPRGGHSAISVSANQFSADGTDVVLGNIPAVLDHNDFTAVRTAAIHVLGADAVIRGNHISTGTASGIVLEDAQGAVIETNDLDHLQGYGILLRGSTDSVIRGNRIQSCGYGMAFVLGDVRHPNTAVDNALIDLRYDGIDVIGESPILRGNQVLQARAWPLHVANFTAPDGLLVRAHPLLERNHFEMTAVALPPRPRR